MKIFFSNVAHRLSELRRRYAARHDVYGGLDRTQQLIEAERTERLRDDLKARRQLIDRDRSRWL